MEHVAATVAGARLVELEGCGHDAPFREPVTFADLVVRPLLSA
jgi:pimeloyl-ACP methyl ester carboxylesterase